MKLISLILSLIAFSHLSSANDNLKISILTCSPGEEVYSVFGHSAIRIVNQEKQIDKIYDFGTFDFSTPNFAYKFLKGKLRYHLSIRNTENFIRSYTAENRTLTEQELNLTEAEKMQLIDRLEFLYKPENRYYFYSFLEKDCSTDLRDLLSFIGVSFSDQTLKYSKRDLLNSYLIEKPWTRLGINLILGMSLDEKSSHFQSMFLPKYLQHEVGNTSFHNLELVKEERSLNSVVIESKTGFKKFLSPLVVFSFLLIVFLFWTAKPMKLLFCLVTGVIGLMMVALWLFSEHPELKSNLNILWCNPLYLLYIPLFLRNKHSKFLTLVLSTTLIISTVVWIFNFQAFDISVIPILMILGLINFRELKKMGCFNLASSKMKNPVVHS